MTKDEADTIGDGMQPEAQAAYERVLRVYDTIGADSAIIRQWCIPQADAEALFGYVRQRKPKRILEVGTYVGVSTLVMALADPDAQIVTIDPNLPLYREMSSMHSSLGSVNGQQTTFEIAGAAAKALSLAHRIRFAAGGFAVGDTFSSIRRDQRVIVPVVGSTVCEKEGPFDLIFIDALHYAFAVQADVALAARALTPKGVLLAHDCIGAWGTNVRAGIYRFLAENPEFRLMHPRYSELYRSIGVIFRAADHAEFVKQMRSEDAGLAEVRARLQSVGASLCNRLRPAEIIEIINAELPSAMGFSALGVPTRSVQVYPGKVSGQADPWSDIGATLAPFSARSPWWPRRRRLGRAPSSAPLVVSFGLIDHIDDDGVVSLLKCLAARNVVAVFGFTPPGEIGAAGPHSRPMRRFLSLVWAAGLEAASMSSFDLDPVQFGFVDGGSETARSSYCANIVLVADRERIRKLSDHLDTPMLRLEGSSGEAVEQNCLLRVHYSCAFQWSFDQIKGQVQRGESLALEVGKLQEENAALKDTAVDLRRQIGEYTNELGNKLATETDLRRQLADQVMHGNALAERIQEYETLLRDKDGVIDGLHRELAEQASRADGLVRQLKRHEAHQEESNAAAGDLRRQIAEQVTRGDELAQQIKRYEALIAAKDAAVDDLRRQLAEQVARADSLVAQQ